MPRCATIYADEQKNRDKNRVGKQCGKMAENDTPYCRFHGGASSQVINKARTDRYVEEVKAELTRDVPAVDGTDGFTDLWDEGHVLLDPFSLLLWDIRRCGSRIEWFDRKIEALGTERELWFGLTRREEIGASEFAGTNKTYEARENILVKMQNEERKRLQSLRDQWQSDKFESARMSGYGAFRASMTNALQAVLVAFGHDLSEPDVQATLRAALKDLPDPIAVVEAAVKERA